MASESSWIIDAVGDFIHSRIWKAPIYTFIDANCATFDYDDEGAEEDDTPSSPSTSLEEQMKIHEHYQSLVDALIDGLGNDLGLDKKQLREVCQIPTGADDTPIIDESFEQLYSARDFQLFQEMMRRKNLILQLQALVSLQLQWGLLKQSDAGDDLILSLLLQATSASSRRGSVGPAAELTEEPVDNRQLQENEDQHGQHDDDDDDDDVVVVPQRQPPSSSRKKRESEPKKPPTREYNLPDLRRKGGELDAEWHRDLQRKHQQRDDDDDDDDANAQAKNTSTPQSISAISEKALREKLHELTARTTSSVDDETAAAIRSRKNFLQQQRDKLVNKQRAERTIDLEQQSHNARPQSAAHVARKAMSTANKTSENKQEEQQQTQISDDELIKRRAMAAKLKREVVDKR